MATDADGDGYNIDQSEVVHVRQAHQTRSFAPAAYATVATDGAARDITGLILSLALCVRNARVYVLSDATTKRIVEQDHAVDVLVKATGMHLQWIVALDAYTGKGRAQMEREGTFKEFLRSKPTVMRHVLTVAGERDVLFLDADIFVTAPLLIPTMDKPDTCNDTLAPSVALSRHHIRDGDEKKFGTYNAGVVWCNDARVLDYWESCYATSRFYEQACLEDVAERFASTLRTFDQGTNLSWWRIFQGVEPASVLRSQWICDPIQRTMRYKGTIVRCVHTHLYDTVGTVGAFNTILASALLRARMGAHLLVMDRIRTGQWHVVLPAQPQGDPLWQHSDDSFRELVARVWVGRNYCMVVRDPHSRNCWLGRARDGCLLYDRPTINWYRRDSDAQRACTVLSGNVAPNDFPDSSTATVFQPWTFWARHPGLVEDESPSLRHVERTVSVVFIGNIENNVQAMYRVGSHDWSTAVDDFVLTTGTTHALSPLDYLARLARARFGLCLRGYGAKCHRETELMAVGTVPIVTNGVDIMAYAEPPQEGLHFIRVNEPSEITTKVAAIDTTAWLRMSSACVAWWQRNCSAAGAWRTTLHQALVMPEKRTQVVVATTT